MMRYLAIVYLVLMTFLAGCRKDLVAPTADTYWQTEDPATHGLNPDSLSRAVQQAQSLPNFYALLVARNNKLVVEEYFKGKKASSLLHLRSITKNITSALAGVAMNQQILIDLDQSIESDFPSVAGTEKAHITLRHLLNMASGLEWNEDDEVIDLIEHRIPDPVYTILSRDLVTDPGTTFNYNSVSTHIAAEVISRHAGQTLLQFAEEQLFEPLGINAIGWDRDPNGRVWGGFGLQFTARDLAKFGQLYLNEGIWEGRQIIATDWVQLSQTRQIDAGSSSSDYSLHWWIATTLDTPLYFGLGYGGQVLMILPEKELLIVALQEHLVSFQQNNTQWQSFQSKVFGPILRAIQ